MVGLWILAPKTRVQFPPLQNIYFKMTVIKWYNFGLQNQVR